MLGVSLLFLTSGTLASAGLLAARDSSTVTASVPSSVPTNAVGPIDPDFPGFAVEEASFVEYALFNNGSENAFSRNLMASITSRTGGKTLIRLGGTSADYAKLLPGQANAALPRAEVNNYQDVGGTTIGPSYWDLCKSFPNAQYIIQTPLATTNVSESVAWAKSAVEHLGKGKIYSIEIGNEPDLYSNNFGNGKLAPPNYQGTLNNETYAGNFSKYLSAITAAVDVPAGRVFQAFDVSTHFGANVGAERYVLDVETVFKAGIDSSNRIGSVAHHYYQNNAGDASTLASGLMDMANTHNHLDQFKVRINWLKANRPNITFVLSEVGNSLDATHSYQYQNRLGSALWQTDFYLYAMSIGVDRIYYQQIMHAGYSLWLPVESNGTQPQVFANYYSQPFVADFIGSSGKTKVSQLSLTGVSEPNMAAYAAYEAGVPKRIAVANLNYWNQTSSGTARPSVTVRLSVPSGVTSVTVNHLNSPLGAGGGADSITYAGSKWTHDSAGTEVKGVRKDTNVVNVSNGVAQIEVLSSEAVLITL